MMTLPERPWLSEKAVEFIDARLQSSHTVFEWGSGGSTLYFAPKVKRFISIENDSEWQSRLQHELVTRRLDNVMLLLVGPNEGKSEDIFNLDAYATYAATCRYRIFRAYAQEIDKHDGPFDFVMVDGRARICCLRHAQAKVPVGGYVMLDDSERSWYEPGKRLFDNPCWELTVVAGKEAGCTTHFWRRLR